MTIGSITAPSDELVGNPEKQNMKPRLNNKTNQFINLKSEPEIKQHKLKLIMQHVHLISFICIVIKATDTFFWDEWSK